MGMDPFEVGDFLDDKAIPENNIELIIDFIKSTHYQNPLKLRR
jgi:hypothetical protein